MDNPPPYEPGPAPMWNNQASFQYDSNSAGNQMEFQPGLVAGSNQSDHAGMENQAWFQPDPVATGNQTSLPHGPDATPTQSFPPSASATMDIHGYQPYHAGMNNQTNFLPPPVIENDPASSSKFDVFPATTTYVHSSIHQTLVHPEPSVPNELPFSIFTCLCCCWPLGLAAIILSSQANSTNDPEHGRRLARTARMINIFAIVFGVIIISIVVAIQSGAIKF